MPGWSNSDNKFGPTPFVVGTVLGDGCNYISIQSAINDCFAVGGGVVYIRPGTYVENLSFLHHVDLHGVAVDGRLPGTFAEVQLIGNHTFSPLAGTNICILENISFNAAAADVFTCAPAAGAFCVLGLKYCGVFSPGRCLFANPAPTGFVQFSSLNSDFQATGVAFDLLANFASVDLENCEINSSGAEAIALGDATCGCVIKYCLLSASTDTITALGSSVVIEYSELQANNSCVSMPSANVATLDSYHNIYRSNAASGFYVDDNGQGSSYAYADDVAIGSATSYQFSVSPKFWRPTATAVAAPGTTDPRGTACFDNTDFTVTDGFVQLNGGAVAGSYATDSGTATPALGVLNVLGGPGVTTSGAGNTITINSVVWTTHVGPATVGVDTGSFDAGPTTLTLPAAPAQGEECRFVSTSGATVIQAVGAQRIRIGNSESSIAGTATATSAGNTLWLTYYSGTDRWYSVATNGNWTLA